MASVQELLNRVVVWAESQDDVLAVALVGSQARGNARPDSDIDLVILVKDPRRYLADASWVGQFGTVASLEYEDWGMVQSLRVRHNDGYEVELGVTSPAWAAKDPVDEGTRKVAADGLRILLDPHGLLAALVSTIAQ